LEGQSRGFHLAVADGFKALAAHGSIFGPGGIQFSSGTPFGFWAATQRAMPPSLSSFMPAFSLTLYFLWSLGMKKPFS